MDSKRLKKRWAMGLIAACLVLAALAFVCEDLYTETPFQTEYTFISPSGVFPGESGRVYVIDNGKKDVLILEPDGSLSKVIKGGQDSDEIFFYASLVAEGEDGSIYVADARYSGKGTIISQERIFRFDSKGKNPQLVYQISYDEEDAPKQYGNIKSLYASNGKLVFSTLTQSGIAVRTLEDGEVSSTEYVLPNQYISDVDVDKSTLLPVFTNRFGQVLTVDENKNAVVLLDEGRSSWQLCTDGSSIYYTDIAANAVLKYDIKSGEEEIAINGADILYTAEKQGDNLYSTDYMGYYVTSPAGDTYVEGAGYSHPTERIALWTVSFAAIALFVAFVVVLLLLIPKRQKKRNATMERLLIVLSVAACISVLVIYITLNAMIERQTKTTMEQLNLFDDVLVRSTDVEKLAKIDSLSDYRDENYNAVKAPLDDFVDKTYDNGLYCYYILYEADESTIYVVMDYESTSLTRHPVYEWGEPIYTDAFVTKEPVEVGGDLSSYGSWMFVLKPIFDSQGNVAAVMEVGANLDAFNAENAALIWNLILTVASVAVVLLMLILEVIFFAEYRDKRLSGGTLAVSERFPLRTMAFLVYMADCLQDPFISILANQLYTPFWGIPQSVGAALPLSVQVLFAALSALICGTLVRKTGVKKMLCIGFILQMAGFVLCGAMMSYTGLLTGKMIIGIGIGALIVSLNSIAASGDDEKISARSFAAVNAGTLAGVSVGAGVGSLILAFADYSTVYYAGGLLLVLGLLLALRSGDYREAAKAAGQKHYLREAGCLFSNPAVWTFLLLVLMPFLITISYREYFFPLYAAEMGVTETDIGRIYLLCGLMVIYVGPAVTRALIEKLGGKWTVVAASALVGFSTLLFVLVPTFPAAVAGLLLLSIATSFGYASQSTYYSSLPAVQEYGESRALGIYSLFDNGGQTVGPVLYGVALLLGYRGGVMVMGLCVLALLALFTFTNIGGRKHNSKDKKEISE